MPRFAFEAIDHRGTIVRGSIEAANERYVLEQLMAQGHTPVSLRRAGEGLGRLHRIRAHYDVQAFDFTAFLRELSTLLKAGLPVERALVTICSLRSETRAQLRIQQILDRVRSGEPLSRAFAAAVGEAPPHIGRLLAAGEMSGHLPEVMGRIADGLTRTRALKSRLISDMTYPAILIAAMFVVMWVVFHTVLPRLEPMFLQAGVELPIPTQILMAVGDFIDAYGWLIITLLLIAAAVLIYSWKSPHIRLRIDRWLLTSRFTFGIPREFEAALFCRNLETMLDGGLPLERALAVAHDGVANRWLQSQIRDVRKAVGEGCRLSQAFKANAPALPPLSAEFAAVGEETGRLAAMMSEVADLLDHAVQTRLARFTTLVVPVSTLVMGALVAGLMAGIVSGVLAVNDLAH